MKKRIWKKVLALLLIVSIAGTSFDLAPIAYAAELYKESEMKSAQNGNAVRTDSQNTRMDSQEKEEISSGGGEATEEAGLVGELKDLREENSKQFLLDDGTVSLVQYDTDVHYQDESGSWQEI